MGELRWFQVLRIGLAALALAAMTTQLAIQLDKPDVRIANFLSIFTIQSNVLAALVLLASAGLALRARGTPGWWPLVRGAAVAYMATTGIVYDVLFADIQADLQLTEPWVDRVLHRLMPLVMALVWLLAPPARPLAVRQALIWLAYPLAYLVYSLVRGPIVEWYPCSSIRMLPAATLVWPRSRSGSRSCLPA